MNRRRKKTAPIVGITCEAVPKRRKWDAYDLLCDHRYARAVKDAGGHPVLLPIAHRHEVMDRYLERIDGLVIVGGDDVDPRLYGERPRRTTRVIYWNRTFFEDWLYRTGRRPRMPILGICYGMQLINVLEGGTLYQDLEKRKGRKGRPAVDHRGRRGRGKHQVRVISGTALARVIGAGQRMVATQHHQGVRDLAPGFIPSAVAADGVVEAIERPGWPEILAVQWHPERTPDSQTTRGLFRSFIQRCARYRRRSWK